MTKEKNTGIITSLSVSEDIKTASGLPASKKYIKRFAEPLLPFLMKEVQIGIYAQYENFRGSFNDAEMPGCGSCSLPVYSSDKSRIAWNIRCIDSGDYIRGGRLIVIDENKPFEYTSELIFPE